MGITDYLSRSPHAREAEDKSLTEVITISFVQSLNKEKNKFLNKAVIDSFSKPFEPKIRQKKAKVPENTEKQTIGKLSESMKVDAKFQPIRFVQQLSRAIKTNPCGKNEKSKHITSELNALSSLVVKPKQSKFQNVLTPKIDNIPISNYANSIIPLDLANFRITDYADLGKMSKR